MDLLNTLVDKGLRRESPTREEALAVLATSDDDAARRGGRGRKGAPPLVRPAGEAQLSGQPQVGPVPRGLLLLLAAARARRPRSSSTPGCKPDEAVRGRRGRGGGRRQAGVPGGERRGPTDRDVDRVSDTIEAIKEQSEGVEVCACLGLLSEGQAGAAAGGRAPTRTTTTSTPPRGRTATSRPPTPTPTGWTPCTRRTRPGSSALLGPDRGHGRERRGPGRRGLLAAGAGPGLGAGELPDPVRGHAARQGVEPRPRSGACASWRWCGSSARTPRCARRAGARSICAPMQPLALHLANSIFLGDYLTSEGQARARRTWT